MRKLFLAILFVFASTLSHADSESDGAAAEKAGHYREALDYYVAALQASGLDEAKDIELREKIIALSQKLKPAPPVPQEARRFSVRGQVLVKEAKKQADYDEAAGEFEKALKLAPWWVETYYNAALAYELAGKMEAAIRNLKLYLMAAPNAADAQQVQDKLYALELKQERQKKEQAETARKAVEIAERKALDEALRSLLGGVWKTSTCFTGRWDRKQSPGLGVCNMSEYRIGGHWWTDLGADGRTRDLRPFTFAGEGTVEAPSGFYSEGGDLVMKVIGRLTTRYPLDLWAIEWQCQYRDGRKKKAWLAVSEDNRSSFTISCMRDKYSDEPGFDPNVRYPYTTFRR